MTNPCSWCLSLGLRGFQRNLTMNKQLSTALREFITGPLNQLIVNLGGQDGDQWEQQFKQFLRKEPCWTSGHVMQVVEPAASASAGWTVDDEGNIHFTLTSNGFTHEQWEQHLEDRGWRISDYARQVLRRASEAPTNGVAYNIVVRPSNKISNSDRITKNIRAAADKKGWLKPHWEVACLIRDTFTDKELEDMGLWYIVTMHEPINDSGGGPFLLNSDRDDGGRWLSADYGRPGDFWSGRGGFAFVVPQGSPQT